MIMKKIKDNRDKSEKRKEVQKGKVIDNWVTYLTSNVRISTINGVEKWWEHVRDRYRENRKDKDELGMKRRNSKKLQNTCRRVDWSKRM